MSPCKIAWKVKSWRGIVCLKSEIISYESLKTRTWADILFNKEITHMGGKGAKLQCHWSSEREHKVAKPEARKADVMNQVIIYFNLWS